MREKSVRLSLILVTAAAALAAPSYAQDTLDVDSYIENPQRVEENQEPPHVPLLPFRDAEQALRDDWDSSPYHVSLDGQWAFRFDINPRVAPQGFERDDYDVSVWDRIRVPSPWQTQGYGHNIYRNVPQALHPYDPPRVPDDLNGTGSYRRIFDLPEDWDGRRVFLHFEGVKSASFVWLNGAYVGYDQGGMTSAEYDITSHLRPGENTLAVRVIRWSDGSYLEDQDMWRFAGIYRSVYLFSTPDVHIRDFFVRTDLDEEYEDATLHVDAQVRSYALAAGRYEVRAELVGDGPGPLATASGHTDVSAGGETTVSLRADVARPRKWTAETPNLYTLVVSLLDPSGDVIEVLSEQVGFRELEMRDGQALLNGVAVIMKGVNRHEHHPELGRTMTRELMLKDLELLKQFNVNAVRHSHYPDDPEWYDLANEYGIYLVDEVNAECHHAEQLPQSEWPYGERLSNVVGWETSFMDRFTRMLERDKNSPSIVIWSTGNECGLGRSHYAMADYARKRDAGRFLYHQSNFPPGTAPYTDIDGPRYLTPEELSALGSRPGRPVILGEYAHAMGNSLGHFDGFWDAIFGSPRLQGGYIWDWADQGLRSKRITTRDAGPHAIDATLMGRPQIVDGKRGQAVALSGLDDWVEVYDHPALDITGKALTLEAWVYPRGWNGAANPLVTKGNRQYGLEQTGPRELTFSIQDARRDAVTARIRGDWDYNWHHVAGVYDGSKLALYIDGEVVAEKEHRYFLEVQNDSELPPHDSADGLIDRSHAPVNIGRNASLHTDSFAGFIGNAVIDEVRIHDKALDATQLGFHLADPLEPPVLRLDFDAFEEGEDFYAYGSSPFLLNGVVSPDRTPQPELFQMKRSQAPVRVDASDLNSGMLLVHNRFDFTPLSEIDASWTLSADDEVVGRGTLDLDIAPHSEQVVHVPYDAPQIVPGAWYWLTLSFTLPEATSWAPQDHEIAFDQFQLPISAAPTPLAAPQIPAVTVTRNVSGGVTVAGPDFTYTFTADSGLASMVYRGQELLARGPEMAAYRAPIDNELSEWGHAEASDWRRLGLDQLSTHVQGLGVKDDEAGPVVVELHTRTARPDGEVGFDSVYRYRIFGTGDIAVEHAITPFGRAIPWLPRLGLRMELLERFDTLTWYGRGPFETYPDRKTGARISIYSGSVDEQFVPYIHTQGNGNKTDVRWAALTAKDGVGLAVFSDDDALLNVAVSPYANVDRARYRFQLKRSGTTIFDVDYEVSGVGGTPVPPRPKYVTYPRPIRRKIRLRPFDASEVSPLELGRQRLPE